MRFGKHTTALWVCAKFAQLADQNNIDHVLCLQCVSVDFHFLFLDLSPCDLSGTHCDMSSVHDMWTVVLCGTVHFYGAGLEGFTVLND